MGEYLAHKIQIYPDERQRDYFYKAFGIKKFIWNSLVWGYKQPNSKGEYIKYSKQTSYDMYESIREDNPFLTEVTSRVIHCTINKYDETMKRSFEFKSPRPRYKKRVSSFTIDHPFVFRIRGRNMFIEKLNKLPKSSNGIKMKSKLRLDSTVKQVTISLRAGKWYASILVENEHKISCVNKGKIGVDMGVKNIGILSDGTKYDSNNKLRSNLKKLGKLQRALAKKTKDSSNYHRALLKIQKLYDKIVNQRNDLLHKVSNDITNKYRVICIEDLKPSKMKNKSRRLNLLISDASFWEFRRQLEYKAKLKGGTINVVPQWFPSTKMCSRCYNVKKNMQLSARVYKCRKCGLTIDRDINAAINIKRGALSE